VARQAAISDSVLEESNFSKGIIRDTPRTLIPSGGVYDASDFLLHQPGVAIKRGGTSYAGPALGAKSYAQGVVWSDFPAGGKLVGIANDGNLYTVTSGTTTALGGSTVTTIDKPKLRVGGGKNLLLFPQSNGTGAPVYYDGSAAPATITATNVSAGKFCSLYKSRLVLGNQSSTPQRLFFSPTLDITTTWDANSWIDASYPVSGLASLSNALLIFSYGHTERITGTNPPTTLVPAGDMVLSPLGDVGCTDARSIVVVDNNAIFASPRGVYLTNGVSFLCLTQQGLIETYWQSLFSGYDPSTWTISAGLYRSSFLFISILDNNGASVVNLMCNIPTRAWWRLTNMSPTMFSSQTTAQEELYYSDRSSARVLKLSGLFSPSSSNKNDADGTAVTPMLETRSVGPGTGIKSFSFSRVSYYMSDAASDNPTMALTVKTGIRASSSNTPSESPLLETTDVDRKRFTVAKDAQAVAVKLQQSNASANTEIYGIEIEYRGYPLTSDGVS
jgi:hypothetical protein